MKVPTTLPLTFTGIVIYMFAIYAVEIPMVFTDAEHRRKYIFLLAFCYLMGFVLMMSPLWFFHV